MQRTIARDIAINGIGLHGGKPVRMILRPAAADAGLNFVRTDLGGTIAVDPANWVEASLCTILRNDQGHEVRTVEHLLAALHGCGVHNARIEIDGPEVPILDGSAAPFVRRILETGLREAETPLSVLRVLREVTVKRGDARATLRPSAEFRMSFDIDFADPAIGRQTASMGLHNGTFLRELSDCRTFCMRGDVELMQANGLALGGTLDNAVVFDNGQVLSPGGLRRKDEPVRHKMLDAMGDLYVLGRPLLGHYEGVRAGHALTGLLLRALLSDPRNYRIEPCDARLQARLPGTGTGLHDLPLSA
ncbi:MAG: UDP-3-0-acyl N-acetylglucosamine deacetylase LpxC [Roseibaca calidilacus]|uniref:UDP-3-O-acyl-N-acetylglucosamine deacetylase n=1 Tax=Roseibaca calidilacus TaxID=1666912 RepID=A0A0N8K7I6_9RHOB|nr:UDP-3-O-acyl-N-acetylglucosamine deacetylase [Roseibaca calidilacus]KPP91841.1 MAG: UDP-3-0-acyl N-acetylglucosamine deacetylase LpxC [Roseibaca calidilacus]CUX82426.1 UDP-3-O-[3-hydroxymyristoyl] N-acetylglucosamine deacetylase [Roseibaca calidilacus]